MLSLDENLILEDTVKSRKGLPIVAAKLNREPCKIAYLGASVTAQKTGYRPFLHQWFVKHFRQSHLEINAGVGGIISRSAVFLMDDNVIRYKPDLCFVEYTTADMDKGYKVGAVIEGIVRKLLSINCEICFLYLYKQNQNFEIAENQVLSEYERVADFYQLPSINVGKYLERCFQQEKMQFANLFRDNVHTHNEGSRVTSEYIATALKSILQTHEYSDLLAQQLYPQSYEDTKIVNLKPSMLTDTNAYLKASWQDYTYYQIDAQNEICLTIEGVLTGITAIVGRDSGIVELATPDLVRHYNFWDSYCHYDRFTTIITELNFSEPTQVKIRLTEKAIDYSTCRRELTDIDKISKNLRILGFMVCDGNIL